MSIEHRPDDRVSKAKQASDNAGSLFQPTTHSKPIQPNRRPVKGQESKHTLTEEELAAIPPFRGEEQPPVEKWAGLERHWAVMGEDERRQERMQKGVVKTVDTGDGVMRGYANGASVWLSKTDPLAGTGIEVLEKGSRP